MGNNILKRPVITEQSVSLAGNGKFTFEVSVKASKDQIKDLVEKQFGVNVIGVNTTKVAGKRRRVGKNRRNKVGLAWKKAIVELRKGEEIGLFEAEKS